MRTGFGRSDGACDASSSYGHATDAALLVHERRPDRALALLGARARARVEAEVGLEGLLLRRRGSPRGGRAPRDRGTRSRRSGRNRGSCAPSRPRPPTDTCAAPSPSTAPRALVRRRRARRPSSTGRSGAKKMPRPRWSPSSSHVSRMPNRVRRLRDERAVREPELADDVDRELVARDRRGNPASRSASSWVSVGKSVKHIASAAMPALAR